MVMRNGVGDYCIMGRRPARYRTSIGRDYCAHISHVLQHGVVDYIKADILLETGGFEWKYFSMAGLNKRSK